MTAKTGFDGIRELLYAASGHAFPGAVLRVDRGGEALFEAASGAPGRPDAVYDLASLTKPLATTTVLMSLASEGLLSPSDPLGRFFPESAGSEKGRLSLASLLDHSSGLPWWRPYYRAAAVRAALPGTPEAVKEVLRRVLAEPLVRDPGIAAEYSDLGFILLGQVVERACGLPLDRAFAGRIAGPLGLSRTFFLRHLAGISDPSPVPLSEVARTRRRTHGRVHDDNAYVLGGVAGHAGLFGTAQESARILAAIHAAFVGSSGGPFAPHVVRAFMARSAVPGSTRTLGFDCPSPSGSLAGDRHPPRLVGHTGFTGTMFWLDLDSGISVVLLTNRVLAGVPIPMLNAFRREVMDAVWDALRQTGHIGSRAPFNRPGGG